MAAITICSDFGAPQNKVCYCFHHLPISAQFSRSVVSDSLRPHELQRARPPCHHQLPEFTQTHVHWVGDVIQPSHPLSSPSPVSPIPLSIRIFSNESTLCMRWPKYWSFSFRISPSKEHPGLISFRVDWWDLLAAQPTHWLWQRGLSCKNFTAALFPLWCLIFQHSILK